MINFDEVSKALKQFKGAFPFDHCVVDNFFEYDFANTLSNEFLDYQSEKWYHYQNPIEDKKALNDWNSFPENTYNTFFKLQSDDFLSLLSEAIGKKLYVDHGLHGGGWHIHGSGGNLNPHLDYSIHPKVKLQRKLNIIIYLSKELEPKIHGGHLGLWTHNPSTNQPDRLAKEVEPIFNRAIIFDTTQNSWHGMSQPLTQPEGIYRKSLAIYYLCEPGPSAPNNSRALFAPRENQLNNEEIQRIIKLRMSADTSHQVYKVKK